MFRALLFRNYLILVFGIIVMFSPSATDCLAQNQTSPLPRVLTSPAHPTIAMEQLKIRILEHKLEALLEKNVTEGEEFEKIMAEIEERQERLYRLHQELAQERENKARTSGRNAVVPPSTKLIEAEKEQIQKVMKSLEKERERMQAQMKQLHNELKAAHKELERSREHSSNSKSDQDLRTSIFKTKHTEAERAAELLDELLGDSVRISVDPRTSNLLVKAADEALEAVRNILQEIDQPADDRIAKGSSVKADSLPSSAMLRVFWLCSGSPNKDAPSADSVLPKSVCDGLVKVGVFDAHLVSQATTSMALLARKNQFELGDIPAKVFGDNLRFSIQGTAEKDDSGKLELQLRSTANRTGFGNNREVANQFSGSIVTPLDHYVILGTTSYATSGQQNDRFGGGMGEFGGGYGGRGYGGFGGEGGYGGAGGRGGTAGEAGEPGQDGAPGADGAPGGAGERGKDGAAGRAGRGGGRSARDTARRAANTQPDVSQFAYVVQVVAAETYEPEGKATSREKKINR